jgi:hypothetical protein
MTRRLPLDQLKPHPRALNGPLPDQPVKVRRNWARQRAMITFARRYAVEYRGLYWDELKKVGLE